MPSQVRPVCGHCLRSAPGTALLLLAFYAAVEAEKPEGWTKLKYKLCLLDLASAKLDQKLLIGSMATFAESRAKDEDTLATTNFSSYPNGTDIKARLEAALVEKKISDAEYVYKHIEVSECAPTEVEASEEKADTCLALDLSGGASGSRRCLGGISAASRLHLAPRPASLRLKSR